MDRHGSLDRPRDYHFCEYGADRADISAAAHQEWRQKGETRDKEEEEWTWLARLLETEGEVYEESEYFPGATIEQEDDNLLVLVTTTSGLKFDCCSIQSPLIGSTRC